MSEKIPRISPDKAIKAIKKLGFKLVRQSGSHQVYRNDVGIRIVIPYHSDRPLHPKIIKTMLRDLNMSIEEFKKLY